MYIKITYAQLRQLLAFLNFEDVSRDDCIAFRHTKSEAVIILPVKADTDVLDRPHFAHVRNTLLQTGLVKNFNKLRNVIRRNTTPEQQRHNAQADLFRTTA